MIPQKRPLLEQIQDWFDGELPDEHFRQSIDNSSFRKNVSGERKFLIVTGRALAIERYGDETLAFGHVSHDEILGFLNEKFHNNEMNEIKQHLINCKQCFNEYIESYEYNDIEPIPLPEEDFNQILQKLEEIT